MCKRRKEKRAQREKEKAQIISLALQQVEERKLHATIGRRDRTIKRGRN